MSTCTLILALKSRRRQYNESDRGDLKRRGDEFSADQLVAVHTTHGHANVGKGHRVGVFVFGSFNQGVHMLPERDALLFVVWIFVETPEASRVMALSLAPLVITN